MSTHVTIVKKPSGHNLLVQVLNPGATAPSEQLLADNQACEVLVYGAATEEHAGGTITLCEIDKSVTMVDRIEARAYLQQQVDSGRIDPATGSVKSLAETPQPANAPTDLLTRMTRTETDALGPDNPAVTGA